MKTDYERFAEDIECHEVQIVVDEGERRHLKCGRPGTYCQSFDIITWRGYLAYVGDMGSYVFTRLPDMFEFFRGERPDRIDFDYWAQKCIAVDKSDGLKRYSEDRFYAAVKADYDSFVEQHELTTEQATDLWQQIEDDVLSCGDTDREAMDAAMQFRWVPADLGRTKGREVFSDFWGHRLEDWTSRFTWCCYALRWAISKYDSAKAVDTAKSVENASVSAAVGD